ncbi:ABC transporter ATP-binding protein [Xylocopilactobacillus apicola]|uniref:ABC transporter n=1 Tax=Xylocopilactobacillus apicola TaxID=2932184 RepID=A0AAU9D4J2_9LACO|nr:ABC transporter ATP-binding protein [Xylocopilactobacillus apicola]BDR58689.1 ABC transporter [Xylocopilactobacillus apicola]
MIKKLLTNLGEYKKDSIIIPIYVTGEAAMDVITPMIMAILIDQGINKGNRQALLTNGLALVVCAALSFYFGVKSVRTSAEVAVGFARNLRHNIFARIQTFSFSNIDRFSPSSLVTRMTTDVTNIQNAYQMGIRIIVRSPLMIIFALIVTFFINPQLAQIYLWVIPFLVIGMGIVIHFAHPLFNVVFRIYDKLNNVVSENLQGIRAVKSYVREDEQEEKFNEVSKKIYQTFMKAEQIVAFNMPILQVAVYTCMLLISWFGAQFIVDGKGFTEGQLLSMFSYTMEILINLNMMSMIFVMILMSRPSVERVVEVLSEQSDIKNPANPVTKIPNSSVEFKDVSFSYQNEMNNLVLKNINLKVQPGELIGILGGTGSAKSTLVQLIARLYDVTDGEIKVGGLNVKNYDLVALRDQVGMVLQNNVLFHGTIKENLKWGNSQATDDEVISAAKIAQADGFVQEFPEKYDTMISQGGTNVSGGQKQRLTIARALLKKPKILILDDSTSAVDTKTDREIKKGLRETIPGTTTFIISQRISSIEDADRIVVLDDGEINQIGTSDELLKTNRIYQEIYQSQQKGFGQSAGK